MQNRFSEIPTEEITEQIKGLTLAGSHDIYRRMIGLLDLTTLNATDSTQSVKGLVDKVNNFRYMFPELINVAGICVFPRFVAAVKESLAPGDVKIVSVAGSFPSSQTFLDNKIDECKRVMDAGAEEIDIVISLGEFMEGNFELVGEEIKAIKDVIGCTHLKVILETGELNQPGAIYAASTIAMQSGADFIKTSTGKASVSATPEAAWVMCHAIKDFHSQNGKEIGFKPAGGIATKNDALLYYSIVEHVLGKSWLAPNLFRIGASRLANDLLNAVEGRSVNYF